MKSVQYYYYKNNTDDDNQSNNNANILVFETETSKYLLKMYKNKIPCGTNYEKKEVFCRDLFYVKPEGKQQKILLE